MPRKKKGLNYVYVALALSALLFFAYFTRGDPSIPDFPSTDYVDVLTHQRTYPPQTQAQIKSIAKEFDMYHTNAQVDEIGQWAIWMKQENPDMFVGFYKHSICISEQWSGIGFSNDMLSQSEDDWFLKDMYGNVLVSKTNLLKYLDIGNPEVQEAWARSCKKAFDKYPSIDWVKADVLHLKPLWIGSDFGKFPVNPRTGNVYTYDEWVSDTVKFWKTFKQINPNKLVLGNIAPSAGSDIYSDSRMVDHYFRVLDVIDGVQIEQAFRRDDTGWRSESDWVLDMKLITEVGKRNKIVLTYGMMRHIGDFGIDYSKAKNFMLASWLLAKSTPNGKKDFLCLRSGAEEYPNQFKGRIGEPLGSYTRSGDVYSREFTKATVRVDFSAKKGEIIFK